MSKVKQCRSRVLASVHETAEGLTSAGVMTKQTMREFEGKAAVARVRVIEVPNKRAGRRRRCSR